MADEKSKRTRLVSARLYAVDVEELKRRAKALPGTVTEVGWTVFLREYLHKQLRRKKIL